MGGIALKAARKWPEVRIIGYELSPVPIFFARLRAFISGYKNVTFVRSDFFEISLDHADVLLTYLNFKAMRRLEEKFNEGVKEGAVLITHTFPLVKNSPLRQRKAQKRLYDLDVYVYQIENAKR